MWFRNELSSLAEVSLYRIPRLMFLMEVRYVFCEVQTELLHISGGELDDLWEAHYTRQFTKKPWINKMQSFPYLIASLPNHNSWGSSNPSRCLDGPSELHEYVAPIFQDSRHMEGDLVVSPKHRTPLAPPGNTPGTHFCYRLIRTQDHSAARRVISMKNSNDTFGNRNRDLPACSAERHRVPQNYNRLVSVGSVSLLSSKNLSTRISRQPDVHVNYMSITVTR